MKPILALLLALSLVACNKDPKAVMEDAVKAMSAGDHAEAEEHYRWLLERTPNDARLQANLAFALTLQGKDAEAIELYAKLVAGGEGTYDLFAFYAKSLEAVGRTDDAIAWNYRALSLVPQLVDVRGDLAKTLVKAGRPFEALSLLSSFDNELEDKGQSPYFRAQRIAIASSLPEASKVSGAKTVFKTVGIGGRFHAVAVGSNGETLPLLIDTGATHTTMTREAFQMLGLKVPATTRYAGLRTADGREIVGQQFTAPVFQVGPYALRDLPIVLCEDCESLLGQSALERFDLKTSRVDGLDMLSMQLRQADP
ncbi:MAG: retroviral-like aspartic protease family protein [Pseudomonadota bacterium]